MPNPANVSRSSGTIKYELVDYQWRNETTGQLEKNTDTFDPINVYEAVNDESVVGLLVVRLEAGRTLKLEIFPGKTADQVPGFDSAAKTYSR